MHFSLIAQSAVVVHDVVDVVTPVIVSMGVVTLNVVISVVVSIDNESVGEFVDESPLLVVNISSVGMLS